ncbi:MXAN_6652 family MXYO-CTERM-anchored protein [Corallococcus terminator]
MRSFLPSLGVAGALTACLVSGSAFAYSTGQTGYSGKDSALTCASSTCHSVSGATPTVTIEGPSSLEPGQTGTYALVITGGPAIRGGFNVATDGTATLTAGSGSKKVSGELTHTQPKAFTSGTVRFDFTLVAPSTATTLTLFGAGNSTNGNTEDTGDASAVTTLKVKVGDGGGGGGGEDDGGGCAAAGGAPLLGAVLMLLGARLRRRDA